MSNFEHHHHDHHSHHHDHHDHHEHNQEVISNPTVRIYTRAEENYSLSVREGTVVLVPANPRDHSIWQHWYKDFRWGTEVKDEEGLPAFALINKATGLTIKHSHGPTHPVRLIPFNPGYLDESILWTEGHDTGEGFRSIRMVNNIRLGFDAFHGDKDHGGVHDGTTVVLWEFLKGKNQRWKIVPYYCKFSHVTSTLNQLHISFFTLFLTC
ncbi:hypothetical protein KSP40_PGU010384 [Platanthera guangdongensis]|uniref:Ricin B-like lectin R40G3 n=1 Tax=Platanthera guangdongensis TaxID=2320717 RepID=A0ABR2M712_9ASPA